MYGIEAEDFLILNPLLYSDLDKYIWISDSYEEHRSAQQMFDYLMKRNIYVKGFATNVQSIFHSKMYNKPILDVDTLDRKKNIVFFDTCLGKSDNYITYNGEWDRIINPNIDKKDVVIWGAGVTGKYACKILVENGIRVKCFVDSNKKAEDTEKCGLQICSQEQLDEFGKDVTVIEALEKWQQLDACIQKKYERRFHFSLRNNIWDKITCNVEGVEKNIFCLADFWMFSRFIDKKIYIYGNGVIEKEFAKYLRLMDYDFGGFLVDEIEQGDNENKYPIQYVEEILYEKDYYIWVYENKRVQKLRALGLQYFKEYECNLWNWDITNGRKNVLDVNLGYNYTFNGKYPGIMVYGKENETLIAVPKETYDGAIPSGNSVMTYNLVKLWQITGKIEWKNQAEEQLEFLSTFAQNYPAGQTFFLFVSLLYQNPPEHVVCVLKKEEDLEKLKETCDFDTDIIVMREESTEYQRINDSTTLYICNHYSCKPPVNL